jgi:hypothetical protein
MIMHRIAEEAKLEQFDLAQIRAMGKMTAVMLCTTSALAHASNERSEQGAVWVEPVGSIIMALGGGAFASLGTNLALGPNTDLAFEAAFTAGLDWYGCKSSSTGGWAAVGMTFRFGSQASYDGFFIQPKLRARYFSTSGSETSGGWFGCGSSVDGEDSEVGLGLDIGYQIVEGPLFIAPILGVSFNRCFNCPGGDFLNFKILGGHDAREDGLTLGINLNLIRIGFVF